jgi:outer membrane protein OmpA-like peptidoglycan-associated protein
VIKDKTRQEDIKVVGHTDSKGGDAYNYDLSTRRAKNVAVMLAGITGRGDRYEYGGRGETEPKCSNDTAEGRACNRRVEITIFAPNQQQVSRS